MENRPLERKVGVGKDNTRLDMKRKLKTSKRTYTALPPRQPENSIAANVSVKVSVEEIAALPYWSQRQAFMVGLAEVFSVMSRPQGQ